MKGISFIALITLFVLTIPGCSGGVETPGTAPAASSQSAQTNQVNAVARDQVQDGGTFTWAIAQMPSNFNYNELDGAEQDTYLIVAALLPTAFTNDAAGAPFWNRDYLASEPKLTTDPEQVVTYELNPKAAWYDGTPITWQDFFWQWKANNGTDTRYLIASAAGYEDIANVQKGKDDHEVIVTFKQRYVDWTAVFNPFYPASTNRDPKVFNEGWKDRPLTTAGPFKLESIDHTAKTVTLVRNEKWWGAPAKLDKIVYRNIESDAQIDALANGEIDAMDIGPDPSTYNRAKGIPDVEVRTARGPNFRHITLNGTSPNLQDVRVRQALAMAIDRTTIARAMVGPLGIEAQALNNHIFMANQGAYQDNSGEIGKYNPDRAKQLLDEAGWKLDGDIRKKDGKTLDLSFIIPAGVTASKQEGELIQNMLGQVGVTARIESVPLDDLFDKYITPGQFDLTVFSWMGTPYPISSSKSLYRKPTTNARGELDLQQNFARIGSDEIDALFNQANQELDPKKAIVLANRADAMIWQEVHSLTTYQRPELLACKKTLVNFGAFGFASPWVYQDIGWAQRP